MGGSSAAIARTSTPDDDVIAWAEMHLADAIGDIAALKTSTRIWYHRQGHDPVDITAAELVRLDRRVRRLTRLLARKRRQVA